MCFRYKAWGSLLGQQLAERDILVACLDYRYLFADSFFLFFNSIIESETLNKPHAQPLLLEPKPKDNWYLISVQAAPY
jgi:hypothetical protein